MIASPSFRFVRSRPFLAALLLTAAPLWAEVKLASPFTSHLVLQRDLPAPVWGSAAAGERVTVSFAGQTAAATADGDGRWRVDLSPLATAAEPRVMTVLGSKTARPIALDDVLVGEVWLAAGQSNMAFTVSKAHQPWAGVNNEAQEISTADHPQIRMLMAEPIRATTPQPRASGEWQVCSPDTVPDFSAVGYFFARALNRELNVPVGIMTLACNASTAQAWVRREAIEAEPELKAELARFDDLVRQYRPPTTQERAAWQAAVDQAKADGARPPREPKPDPVQNQHNPTVLYNGVLAPMVPFSVRGVIWYQGESITEPARLFPKWNTALINDWRHLWGREMPFYFCQVSALDKKSNSPEVRAMQAQILKLPNTAMVVTIDVGDRTNIHPKNKQAVGERLARVALARDYGKTIESSGPVLTDAKADGNQVMLHFSHVGGGLVAKGGTLKTFEIAGQDGIFQPAAAEIVGDGIVVQTAVVTTATAVRYAWANYPAGANLFNADGLPAAPFQTERLDHAGPTTQPR